MSKHVSDDKVTSMVGPEGTAFYIDTRNCYHLGSRITPGHRRIAYMASFVSFGALQSFNNGVRLTGPVSDFEKMVLTK